MIMATKQWVCSPTPAPLDTDGLKEVGHFGTHRIQLPDHGNKNHQQCCARRRRRLKWKKGSGLKLGKLQGEWF